MRETQRHIEQHIREEEDKCQLYQNIYNLLNHFQEVESFHYHLTPLPEITVENIKEKSPNLQ